jgi:hypothetical protein
MSVKLSDFQPYVYGPKSQNRLSKKKSYDLLVNAPIEFQRAVAETHSGFMKMVFCNSEL